MPTLSPDQVETIFRDDNYEAFLTRLKPQSDELDSFLSLLEVEEIRGYSYYNTNVYASYASETARNPGEPLAPQTNAQGYNYWTAIRSEVALEASIPAEYLSSALKLGDYGARQGAWMAETFKLSYAQYWTDLLAYGAVPAATLLATGVGAAGLRPRTRMYNHSLKGAKGAIISEIPNTDAADPDGSTWFSATHTRANGDTSASFQGKTLGYFNLGSSVTNAAMLLSASNLNNTLLHMENDLPFLADRKMRVLPRPTKLVVSGNLRVTASEIIEINVYQLNTPNNNKNVLFKGSQIHGIKDIIVNRLLPSSCWYVAADNGDGVKRVCKKEGDYGISGKEGPIKDTYTNMYIDQRNQIYDFQFFAFWSHIFDEAMDICWYAGSTPTTLDSSNRPAAPTTFVNFDQ
jgi:hypothetical protein